jgi:hypothetical protein
MPIYLLILMKVLFYGTSQNDINQKLAISQNVDSSVIVQVDSQTWVAKDRTFFTFQTTTTLASYLFSISASTAFSDIQVYTMYPDTFTFTPPQVNVQMR